MFEDVKGDFKRSFISGIFLTTLFLLAHKLIPFLGIFISLITPLPILFYYQKLGRLPCIFIVFAASIVAISLSKLFKTHLGIFFILEFGIIGITFSEMLRKNLSIEKTVLYSVFIILGTGTILLCLYSAINFIGPWTFIEQQINEKVSQTLKLSNEIGMSAEQFEYLAKFLVKSFPSFVTVGIIFILWINLLMAKGVCKIFKLEFPDFGDLSNWKAPEVLVWGIIVSGLLLLSRVSTLESVGLNMLIVFLCVFFFQGISIVSYFFRKKGVPVILRSLGYMLIFFQQIFLLIVIVLGLFDVWVDFRKLNKPKIS
ncbi:MAG: YybS family protein [Pseudomonadota bacterium]